MASRTHTTCQCIAGPCSSSTTGSRLLATRKHHPPLPPCSTPARCPWWGSQTLCRYAEWRQSNCTGAVAQMDTRAAAAAAAWNISTGASYAHLGSLCPYEGCPDCSAAAGVYLVGVFTCLSDMTSLSVKCHGGWVYPCSCQHVLMPSLGSSDSAACVAGPWAPGRLPTCLAASWLLLSSQPHQSMSTQYSPTLKVSVPTVAPRYSFTN